MPYEEIDKELYEERVSKLKEIDFNSGDDPRSEDFCDVCINN